MEFHAEIVARSEEGFLERVLRVCRHRGFELSHFHAAVAGRSVEIQLRGWSERAPQLLRRQLEKLDEVQSVVVEAQPQRVAALHVGVH